ncbi:FG-GAP repeat domain-containing protein [Tahibacter amnicola]|uniref:VCBS repeat-containing protein n=1 Tax=Tahibacter amnicola TaxID=2976241 RepID=A0ABY6BDW9_9GAMM|nr:VCBS repeat-containing protein [Tahibacter amnicola]UXI68039.1 VCBS repeat-containing protein [Tahibacter amnicola]
MRPVAAVCVTCARVAAVLAALTCDASAAPVFCVGSEGGAATSARLYAGDSLVVERSYHAFGPAFSGGARVACGDITGDRQADVVVAAGPGGMPQVRAFDGVSGAEIANFLAFASALTGGVHVAVGDVDGDGRGDYVLGAGQSAQVRVLSGRDQRELHNFFAYAPGFTGGVRVAAGDVDGDGHADIVTGAGPGGGPEIKVFDGATGTQVADFFAYLPGFSGGVFVAAGDYDGDGRADLITGADADAGAGPHVKVFSGATGGEMASFFAFAASFRGGVRVAAGDVDGNGSQDLVMGTGSGTSAVVRVWTMPGLAGLHEFLPFGAAFAGGVYVGASVPVEVIFTDRLASQ